MLEVTPSNITLGALKYEEWKNDNSIIIRFFEDCGLTVSAEVKIHAILAEKILKIEEIDLLERVIHQDPKWDEKKGILRFKMEKFEIRSFKVRLN